MNHPSNDELAVSVLANNENRGIKISSAPLNTVAIVRPICQCPNSVQTMIYWGSAQIIISNVTCINFLATVRKYAAAKRALLLWSKKAAYIE